jgi:hypothetical protein
VQSPVLKLMLKRVALPACIEFYSTYIILVITYHLMQFPKVLSLVSVSVLSYMMVFKADDKGLVEVSTVFQL